MSIFSKVAKGLDRLTGSASTTFAINLLIGEYGKMIELRIDNKNQKVIASVVLKGESSPIEVRIDKYEIIKKDSSASVLVKDASSDKAWVDAVLKNFVIGKSFDVPADKIDFLDNFLG